jgi:D-alanyl-D-alanine carboxypeptidase
MLAKIILLVTVLLEAMGLPVLATPLGKTGYRLIRPTSSFRDYPFSFDSLGLDFSQIPLRPQRKVIFQEPSFAAEGIIALDLPTSTILYQKNSDKVFSLASLTKIMTAIIVLDNYKLDEEIVTPPEAVVVSGSKINLRPGEVLKVKDLLYGLLLYSGNDAAYTLASKLGTERFVAKMNQKAQDLGLKTLYFVDPIGLDKDNRGSLKDVAFLASVALRYPLFAEIVRTNEYTIFSVDRKLQHPLKNTNRLLREYPGTFGVKTGYTEEAGHCLISAVEREHHRVLAVVLHHPNDQFAESKKLFDWIFASYQWQ